MWPAVSNTTAVRRRVELTFIPLPFLMPEGISLYLPGSTSETRRGFTAEPQGRIAVLECADIRRGPLAIVVETGQTHAFVDCRVVGLDDRVGNCELLAAARVLNLAPLDDRDRRRQEPLQPV